MKKSILLFAIAASVAAASCNKTTNNTTSTTTIDTLVKGPFAPAFIVGGIRDVTFTNGSTSEQYLPIIVQYSDSAQETVTLSLSSLPAGITMDTTWITSGIPTYNTELILLDTTQNGATPGIYPMTLTATGAKTGAKTFAFNIKVYSQPPCTSFVVGKYTMCNSSCGSGGYYSDSVYADANVINRLWFTNLNGTGLKLYGKLNCNSGSITVPPQTVGGINYSGNGHAYYSSSSKQISLSISNNSGGCSIFMN